MSKRSLLTLVALLLLPITGLAQNSMIRGKVRTSDGGTVNNAIVELRESTGGVIGQYLTRNDGDFTFMRLGAGQFEVLVTMAGYETAREIVEVRGILNNSPAVVGEVITVDVMLQPRRDSALGPPGTSFVQDVPKAARAAYEKGMAKIREGKREEGIVFLRDATAQYNDYFDAHYALGSEFYRLGKDTEALEALERARQINDRGAAVYYTFGMVMVRQQKFRAAEYAFGKAAELSDNSVSAHFNHAVCLIELALRSADATHVKDLLAQADRELDRAWDLSGKHLNTVFLQRARVHQERGNREAAASELENYLKAEPGAKNAPAIREAIRKLREKK
jgi:Tfp pilus assembly protein PilF